MCETPAGARPSGSNISRAKLFVPSGGFDQDSGGETFSPTQLGLRCLSLPAFLTARVPLSGKAGEVSVNTPAARAPGAAARAASAAAKAGTAARSARPIGRGHHLSSHWEWMCLSRGMTFSANSRVLYLA